MKKQSKFPFPLSRFPLPSPARCLVCFLGCGQAGRLGPGLCPSNGSGSAVGGGWHPKGLGPVGQCPMAASSVGTVGEESK